LVICSSLRDLPVYPEGQEQVKLNPELKHRPPFRQGCEAHAFRWSGWEGDAGEQPLGPMPSPTNPCWHMHIGVGPANQQS